MDELERAKEIIRLIPELQQELNRITEQLGGPMEINTDLALRRLMAEAGQRGVTVTQVCNEIGALGDLHRWKQVPTVTTIRAANLALRYGPDVLVNKSDRRKFGEQV